jgi:hypothetical protein
MTAPDLVELLLDVAGRERTLGWPGGVMRQAAQEITALRTEVAALRGEPVEGLCGRPGCTNALPPRTGPGRPPKYCSDDCRELARKSPK